MKDQLDIPELFEIANEILANEPDKLETMTPKKEANELIDKFLDLEGDDVQINLIDAKNCALICVNEILKSTSVTFDVEEIEFMKRQYWEEVKRELNKVN